MIRRAKMPIMSPVVETAAGGDIGSLWRVRAEYIYATVAVNACNIGFSLALAIMPLLFNTKLI